MATLATVLWTGLSTVVGSIPLSFLGQLVFVSVGGSYAANAVKLYDFVFNTPYAILKELLFSSFGTATLIVVTAVGKLAAKTTFLILKGASRGAFVVVRLTSDSAAKFLQSNHLENEPLVFNNATKHTFKIIETLGPDLSKNDVANDWVLVSPDEQSEALPNDKARMLLESIDLTGSEIEVYDQNDYKMERGRPGTLEDLQLIWRPEPSAPPDDDEAPVLYEESLDQSFVQVQRPAPAQ